MLTPERVKELALTPNFDKGLITEAMIQATVDRHIIPLMGREMYDALSTYATLYDYTERALAHLVVFDHMPRLYMRLSSTGAQTLRADNANTSTATDRAYLQDYYLRQANVYLDLIREELNEGDYAEYEQGNESIGYGTGIII